MQETKEVFSQAAIFQEKDSCNGVTDAVILGNRAPIGTGVVHCVPVEKERKLKPFNPFENLEDVLKWSVDGKAFEIDEDIFNDDQGNDEYHQIFGATYDTDMMYPSYDPTVPSMSPPSSPGYAPSSPAYAPSFSSDDERASDDGEYMYCPDSPTYVPSSPTYTPDSPSYIPETP